MTNESLVVTSADRFDFSRRDASRPSRRACHRLCLVSFVGTLGIVFSACGASVGSSKVSVREAGEAGEPSARARPQPVVRVERDLLRLDGTLAEVASRRHQVAGSGTHDVRPEGGHDRRGCACNAGPRPLRRLVVRDVAGTMSERRTIYVRIPAMARRVAAVARSQ